MELASVDLEALLGRCPAGAHDEVDWMGGQMRLRISCHLCAQQPPEDLVTSVRCIILRGPDALVMSNADGDHIMPGGRRESGESYVDTLRREVREEASMTVRNLRYLGFLFFHHLAEKPPGYRFPYPEFAQLVFAAEFDSSVFGARQPDDYERGFGFRSLSDSAIDQLPMTQRLFLNAAIDVFRFQ